MYRLCERGNLDFLSENILIEEPLWARQFILIITHCDYMTGTFCCFLISQWPATDDRSSWLGSDFILFFFNAGCSSSHNPPIYLGCVRFVSFRAQTGDLWLQTKSSIPNHRLSCENAPTLRCWNAYYNFKRFCSSFWIRPCQLIFL